MIWLAFIFIGSTDLMSAEHTSRIIGPLLHWLFPTISPFTVLRVQFFMRKLAHVSEYAILAVLLYRAFVHTALKGRRALSAGLVLLLCAAYAATDEFHQSFVPSRTASLRDVMIDICGAMLAVILYWSIATRRIIPSRSWSRHQSKERSHSIAEEKGGMPVWRTTGRPAFRDMPDVAGSERRLSSLCAQRAVSLLRCDGRVPKE